MFYLCLLSSVYYVETLGALSVFFLKGSRFLRLEDWYGVKEQLKISCGTDAGISFAPLERFAARHTSVGSLIKYKYHPVWPCVYESPRLV